MKKYFQKYPILTIGLLILALITIGLVITAIYFQNNAQVEILYTPTSAKLTIDGKEYQNGTFNLPRGELQVTIEKDGFKTKSFTFNSNINSKLYTYLEQNDGSYSWYTSHPEDSTILTTIGDFLADQTADIYNKENPIVSKLPIIYANYDENYNYTEFRIDGGSFNDCESDFCLKVTDTTGNNLEHAKELIREAGFNPDNYQILYEYTPIIPLE